MIPHKKLIYLPLRLYQLNERKKTTVKRKEEYKLNFGHKSFVCMTCGTEQADKWRLNDNNIKKAVELSYKPSMIHCRQTRVNEAMHRRQQTGSLRSKQIVCTSRALCI
jgi:hypothetical protein